MSRVEIEFPDCGDVSTMESNGSIVVTMEQCVPEAIGPPPLVPWWAFVLGAIVVIAFIVTTGIVRFRAHERKENDRAKELQTQVELAKAHKICDFCNGEYAPQLKGKK